MKKNEETFYREEIDTFIGILSHLNTLHDFNELVRLRKRIYSANKNHLQKWIVLGRFLLDQFGQCSILGGDVVPADKIENFPKVVKLDDLFAILEKNGLEDRICSSPGSPAPSDAVCTCCGRGWDISDCHKFIPKGDYEYIPANRFVGKTPEQMEAYLNICNIDRRYRYYLSGDRRLRNDIYIDMSIGKEEYKARNNIPENEYGQINYSEDYVIGRGDCIAFQKASYLHPNCSQTLINREVKKEFEKALKEADIKWVNFDYVKNEYGSARYNGDWFLFYTEFGPLRIGWRKRVIEIDWKRIDRDFGFLFEDEKVTIYKTGVHAWSYEKLAEYLKKIKEATTLQEA